jgi:CDGSH-type Zn-finger protein
MGLVTAPAARYASARIARGGERARKGSRMDERLVAQKAPYKVEVAAGKAYWWCACGRSAAQPFCDGSHKGTGLEPVKYRAERAGPVWFCGCKRTHTEPTCDGSHKAL